MKREDPPRGETGVCIDVRVPCLGRRLGRFVPCVLLPLLLNGEFVDEDLVVEGKKDREMSLEV